MKKFIATLAAFILLPFAASADGNPESFVLYPQTVISGGADPSTVDAGGDYQSAYIVITLSALGAGQTVAPRLLIYDPLSDGYLSLGTFATAFSSNAAWIIFVGRAAVEVSGITYKWEQPLPKRWKLQLVTSNTEDVTVAVSVIPVGE